MIKEKQADIPEDQGEGASRITSQERQMERRIQELQDLKEEIAALKERLHGSEERFHSLFENTPVALFTYDRDGNILIWNKALEDILGLPEEEIKGSTLFKTIARESQSERIEGMIQSIFTGRWLADVRWEIMTDHGKARYLSMSMFPVRETEKTVVFGMAIVVDITEKKQLEQALLQTEKMAALGTLASGLAHEVGTPMNVILGRAESILRHTQEEKTAMGLNIIIEQINRMTRLIKNLLTFAQRKPVERKAVQINQIIEKGIEIVEQHTQEKGISVATELDADLPFIWGDGDQLLQVLFNLFMNAVDALPNGGEIRIKTSIVREERRKRSRMERPSKGKQMIEVVFQDTGIGIEPTHLYKIFDPFFTTKPTGKGTGLGLAVVDGIIRDHGGEVKVISVVDQGTTFYIHLPVG